MQVYSMSKKKKKKKKLYWGKNPTYSKNTPYPRSKKNKNYCTIFIRNCAVVIINHVRNLHKLFKEKNCMVYFQCFKNVFLFLPVFSMFL